MAEHEPIIPQDHDQRFKTMIRIFFTDFMHLFFREWAVRFDFSHIEWLTNELMPDPPSGDVHRLDLVAKLRAKEPIEGDSDEWLALIHVEVESPDRTTVLKPRLPAYAMHLRARHELPVLPIVIYLSVALDGLGTDDVLIRFWEMEVHRFRYLYVGLPGLEAEPYVRGDNWLGIALAALMKFPKDRVMELGRLAYERLNTAELPEQHKLLLGECFEAYVPVEESQLQELRGIMPPDQFGRSSMRPRNVTSYDRGLAEGEAKGITMGQRASRLELLEAMIESKFGVIEQAVLEKLRALSDDELRKLGIALLKANSLAELGLVHSK